MLTCMKCVVHRREKNKHIPYLLQHHSSFEEREKKRLYDENDDALN